MKEHPILFSDAMVRAILEGRKTQTRRVVKRTKAPECDTLMVRPEAFGTGTEFFMDAANPVRGGTLQCNCPYGVPGDRLWVRETWATRRDVEQGSDKAKHYLVYRATHDGDLNGEWHTYGHWRPSIHMPRWASRLTLEVVSVRVERLHAISEADAKAEGVAWMSGGPLATALFEALWKAINGPDSWPLNPWVWVVEFKMMEPARCVSATKSAWVYHPKARRGGSLPARIATGPERSTSSTSPPPGSGVVSGSSGSPQPRHGRKDRYE